MKKYWLKDKYTSAAHVPEGEAYQSDCRFNLHAGTLAPSGFGGPKDYVDALGAILAAPLRAIRDAYTKRM